MLKYGLTPEKGVGAGEFQFIRMKKLVLALFLTLGFLMIATSGFSICQSCIVSSNPDKNDGHCRISTYGDVCYNNGSGPACSSTSTTSGDCDGNQA